MCNHYGNYFIKKLFLRLNSNQKMMIFNLIKKDFINICTDKSGTYSIQSLIDVIKTDYEKEILENYLNKNLLLLFCNENSHHVIQKIIIDFPENKRKFINDFIIENTLIISNNNFGSLCVIKFIIMNNDSIIKDDFMKSIKNNFLKMCLNQNSINVINFILDRYGINNCMFMINEIKNNFNSVVNNKFLISFIKKIITYLSVYENKNLFYDFMKIFQKENFNNLNKNKLISNKVL